MSGRLELLLNAAAKGQCIQAGPFSIFFGLPSSELNIFGVMYMVKKYVKYAAFRCHGCPMNEKHEQN